MDIKFRLVVEGFTADVPPSGLQGLIALGEELAREASANPVAFLRSRAVDETTAEFACFLVADGEEILRVSRLPS